MGFVFVAPGLQPAGFSGLKTRPSLVFDVIALGVGGAFSTSSDRFS
ncbi:MAG: hypothetical protein ICV78_16680 [Tolypothrix sp. Co-bin9]|nr:hypothetical protein [Tolypothrix sp. Co-bin9]